MKNILIALGGLLVGVIIGYGVSAKVQEKYKNILKTSIETSIKSQDKLQRTLTESETAKRQLQARLFNLENQLAELMSTVLPNIKASVNENASFIKEPEKETPYSKEDMNRYAKAILGRYEDGGKTAYLEFMVETAKLMAKYNLEFNAWSANLWGGEENELYKAYAVPEIRQWFCGLSAGLFENLDIPLAAMQLESVNKAMLGMAEAGKRLDDPEITQLEKVVMFNKFKPKWNDEFNGIFTEKQKETLSEIVESLIGDESYGFRIHSAIDTKSKTSEECSNAIIQKWGAELKLNEIEKQAIKYLANMYLGEYEAIIKDAESEYGGVFMKYYLERYDNSDIMKFQESRESKRNFFYHSYSKYTREVVNLRFAELQLKYQKFLRNALPDKGELIKGQNPTITLFPYLGN